MKEEEKRKKRRWRRDGSGGKREKEGWTHTSFSLKLFGAPRTGGGVLAVSKELGAVVMTMIYDLERCEGIGEESIRVACALRECCVSVACVLRACCVRVACAALLLRACVMKEEERLNTFSLLGGIGAHACEVRVDTRISLIDAHAAIAWPRVRTRSVRTLTLRARRWYLHPLPLGFSLGGVRVVGGWLRVEGGRRGRRGERMTSAVVDHSLLLHEGEVLHDGLGEEGEGEVVCQSDSSF